MNYNDYIERYLTGDMDDREITWFRKELASSVNLRKLTSLHVDISKALAEDDITMFRGQLDAIHRDYTGKQKKLYFLAPNKGWSKIAAVITGIAIMASALIYLSSPKPTHEEIFSKHYKPYEISIRVRSAEGPANQVLYHAISLYEAGDFQNAALLFEKVLTGDSTRMAVNLYSGISHLEIREFQSATKSFNRIIDHNNNPYLEQAQWYLGFCYLMTGEGELAKKNFKDIAESDSYYKKDALQVYRKIRKQN